MDNRTMTPQMRAWVDQSQGMVRSIASKIFRQLPANVNYDDLVSYGQLGLMQAAHAFQPDRDVSFQTFAYHRVRGAIYDGLGKMSWTSPAVRRRILAERLSAEILEQQLRANQESEYEALVADADMLVKTTERISVVHLLSDSSDEGNRLAAIAESGQSPPDEVIAHRELCELLRGFVNQLPPAENKLIVGTYFEGKTLTEAAACQGKSKSWASRVHTRILEKLGRSLAAHGGADT